MLTMTFSKGNPTNKETSTSCFGSLLHPDWCDHKRYVTHRDYMSMENFLSISALYVLRAEYDYLGSSLFRNKPMGVRSISDTVMITLATPNTLGHWGYLLSSLAFTVYRFGLFMSKSIAERTTCIKVLLISSLILPLLITFGSTALGCYKRYNRFSLAYTFSCSNCDNLFLGISYIDFNLYAGQSIPLIMITAYAIILISVYRNRKNHGGFSRRQSLADARLAFQFIIICSSQYLSTFLFFIIPKVGHGSDWSILVMNSIGK
ncbi:unnamed protein product [Strongylus vulgaris]|uniref:Uncharacterized protein n=1 Tax=Strongylus vulgaris TaxID=40348 RepID=A0A3P7I0X6_STRVU|nr:unnamed protein product [Strongylus vulgaris]